MKSLATDPVSRISEQTRMRHKHRLCRVAGVHMANPRLVRETPRNIRKRRRPVGIRGGRLLGGGSSIRGLG